MKFLKFLKKSKSLPQPKSDTSVIDAIEGLSEKVESIKLPSPARIIKSREKVKDREILLVINNKLDILIDSNSFLQERIENLEIEKKPAETEEIEIENPSPSPSVFYDKDMNPVIIQAGKSGKVSREKRE